MNDLTDLEQKALEFATKAHNGQFRKDGKTPYIEHPIRIRNNIRLHKNFTPELGVAAFLHDVVEDCGVTIEQLKEQFGEKVASLVDWMTNRSKQTGLPRTERKKLDHERISKAPLDAKLLKLFDRLDNISDVAYLEGSFKVQYAKETFRY